MTTQKPNASRMEEVERESLQAISQLAPAGTRDPYLLGYVRVSTGKQDWQLQADTLTQNDVGWFVTETASGAAGTPRPVRDALLAKLGEGDRLVIWKLDRLGRSTVEVLNIIEDLKRRGVQLVSITDCLDTATPQGMLTLTILAAMAQYERELIAERTKAGIEAARARGTHVGRPPVVNREVIKAVGEMTSTGSSIPEISRLLGISERSVSKARKIHTEEWDTYWRDPRYNVTR